jgi:hypothetical protein
MGKGGMEVTQEMKEAGAEILLRELGLQFAPDWLQEEFLVESIFLTMLALAPERPSVPSKDPVMACIK